MFGLVTIIQQKKRWFRKGKVKSKIVSVLGVEYKIITVEDCKNGINMDKISRLAEDCENIILPHGYNFDGCSLPPRINSADYLRRVAINGAVKITEIAAAEKNPISVALFDREGRFTGTAKRLLMASKSLSVVTESVEKYEYIAEQLFEIIGAAPTVSDNPLSGAECDMIVAPFGINGFGFVPMARIMVAPGCQNGYFINSDCFSVYGLCSPCGIDLAEYAAALYLSGAKELISVVPHSMISSRGIIPLYDILHKN